MRWFLSHPIVALFVGVVGVVLSAIALLATDPAIFAEHGPKWLALPQAWTANAAEAIPAVSADAAVVAMGAAGFVLIVLAVVPHLVLVVPRLLVERFRRRASSPASLPFALGAYIIRGDALAQRIRESNRTLPDEDYSGWAEEVQDFLGKQFGFDVFAEFITARKPLRRDAGPYTADVWQQLDQVAAQVELLKSLAERERSKR